MADVSTNQDDLLSVATAGKTTGTQFEMSKEQMKDADGGILVYSSARGGWIETNNSLSYKNNFKTYSNTSSKSTVSYNNGGTSSTLYARSYNNGSVSTWNSYNYGGYSWMAY
ncbi:MAG: hypothetical protein AABY36_03610 [Campylobacterota bacterium]